MKGMPFKLYSDEEKIIKLVTDKTTSYVALGKELIQKQNELFHLLCFLDLDERISLYDCIEPHEPGDFLIGNNGKKTLVEVTECFGNKDSYIYINNQLNILFNRIKRVSSDYAFSIEDAKEKIKELICDKNGKDYNSNNEYDEVILLIVTGEYTGCSSTGNWIIKYLDSCNIKNCIYKVYILDYFASGKDGNPIIIKNVIKEIDDFKNYFRDFKNNY